MQDLIAQFLREIGEDPERAGLKKTPQRWANAMRELTNGYAESPEQIVGDAIFPAETSEMVIIKDISFHSLCEHHLLPFSGVIHIGYIPHDHIIGFSKIPRIVDLFSRRLQVQERLGQQIVEAIDTVIKPKGVGVLIEASHFCMTMLGVRKEGCKAVTTHVRGTFASNLALRVEFLHRIA